MINVVTLLLKENVTFISKKWLLLDRVSKVNYECYTNVSFPLFFTLKKNSFVHFRENVKAED